MSSFRSDVWPPLSPTVYLRRPTATLPYPLGEGRCRIYSRARQALWHAVTDVGLRRGDVVLVPPYHHGSEIEALVAAGLNPRYYRQDRALQPDPADLEEALEDTRARALYLIHYLGFPSNAGRWRDWCDRRGLLLIEDAAQSWLATERDVPVGSLGDVAVFCLYKTFGVPDGAAIVTRSQASAAPAPRGLVDRRLARRHLAWLEQLVRLPIEPRGSGAYHPDVDFALGSRPWGVSRITKFLLPRVVSASAATVRRANYAYLLEHLGELVPEPFNVLPAGAAPWALPISVRNKKLVMRRLRHQGVSAIDFWSVSHPSLEEGRYGDADDRRRSTLALPTHQELRPRHLANVVRVVRRTIANEQQPRIRQLSSLSALPGEWEALAEASGNIFATREWLTSWWRHFGADRQLLLFECRTSSGRLVAILPLYRYASRPLHVVRFLGHGPGDELGPICAPADRSHAARALRRIIHALDPDVFLGEQLPGSESWKRLGGTLLRQESSPILRFRGHWEDFLATRSANFRQQVRRRERRLIRDHAVVYRLCQDPDRLETDLAALIRLHADRWGTRSSTFSGPRLAFQLEFARSAMAKGWLRLWLMEADGRAVGAWYGFRFGGVESYYQAGRDQRWQKHAIGTVLLAHSIRAALEDGVGEYRFLRGGEAFKFRFASEDLPIHSIGMARTLVGRLAVKTAAAVPPQVANDALRLLGYRAGR